MKRVVMLVDQKARDLASVMLIGEYLTEFGIRVSYCNKHNMLATVEHARPDVLVLSCSEGQYRDLARYAAPGCKIALLTQEGACATKASTIMRHTFAGLGHECYLKGLSRVYLWGELSRRWLLDACVYPPAIVRVLGTSRVDTYRRAEAGPKRPEGRIRVGFASRGAPINPPSKVNHIKQIDATRAPEGSHRAYVDEERGWEDWIWHTIASLRVNLELIERLDATDRYEIVFRPDPYEDYTSYRFLSEKYPTFRLNVDPLLCNFIDDIDVLVTEFSTTGTDALLVGKPVISTQKLLGPRLVQHTRLTNHINPEHMRLFWQPADIAEFMAIVEKAATGRVPFSPAPEVVRKYLWDFYQWPTSGLSAAYRIARDLEMLCAEKKPPELVALQRAEYREHPWIERQRDRLHVPSGIVRTLFLRPTIMDALALLRAFMAGDLCVHLRMNFYWWERRDRARVRKVFRRLRAFDATVIHSAPSLQGEPSTLRA